MSVLNSNIEFRGETMVSQSAIVLAAKVGAIITAASIGFGYFQRGRDVLNFVVVKPCKWGWTLLNGAQICRNEVALARQENAAALAAQNIVMAKMTSAVDEIRKEITPNGGTSIKDAIVNIEKRQTTVIEEIGGLRRFQLEQRERNNIQNDLLSYGVLEMSSAGEITYVNEFICNLTGRRSDDLKGNNWLSYICVEDREKALEEWNNCIKFRRDISILCRFMRMDGERVMVDFFAKRLVGDDKKTMGWQGTIKSPKAT